VAPSVMHIGKCTKKVQGKLIVLLNGINLPKIGSKAFVKKDGKEIIIGEVSEAIGSTQKPWIVISTNKKGFGYVELNEEIFTKEIPQSRKFKKKRYNRKKPRKRKI
jgi:rRNA processing protein Gar1